MNGSKGILLILILILSLLPWGGLFYLLNADNKAEIFAIETIPEGSVVLTAEEADQQATELAALKEEATTLQGKIQQLQSAQEENPGANAAALQTIADLEEDKTELQNSIQQLQEDNRLASAEIERLRTEYTSALSEVVKLKTQQMASEAAPRAEPPPAQSTPRRTNPDPGGWILPPSN